MGKTLEYDIFDAMVERLLCPLKPLGERAKAPRKAEAADQRSSRKPSLTTRPR